MKTPKKDVNIILLFSIFLTLGILPVYVSGLDLSPPDVIEKYGYQNPRIQVEGTITYIEYFFPVEAIGSFPIEMNNIAKLLTSYGSKNNRITIRQYFSDGQILEISGYPDDGKAYLRSAINIEELTEKLTFFPRTRGLMFTGGSCKPGKGESCTKNPQCTCYSNEICAPENPKADSKGCVVAMEPANALAWGNEYVCKEGYSWNSDATGCVPTDTPSAGNGYGMTQRMGEAGTEDIGLSIFIPCWGFIAGLFIFLRLQYPRLK